MPSGRVFELLPHLLLYFAPTLVGWLRIRSGREDTVPLWWLFALNLLFGWTTIGWLLLWPLALGWWIPRIKTTEETQPRRPRKHYEPVFGIWGPDDEKRYRAQQAASTAPTAPAPTQYTPTEWETPALETPCRSCGNQGAVCPSCLGARGHMVSPQTESGTSYWVNCSYCTGSGRVQCSTCGRSG